MKYTIKNNTKISLMTLGTVQIGMDYGINNPAGKPAIEEGYKILDTAGQGGVCMLDTSDDYGKSEEIIGDYFRKNKKQDFEICTKFSMPKENDGHVYPVIRQFAVNSIKKLSINAISIFMCHSEKDFDLYGSQLTDALKELKNEGFTKNIGISVSDKSSLRKLIDCRCFDAIQIPMNLFDHKEVLDGTIKGMQDAGIAVFVRSVYLQGLFFRDPVKLESSKLKDAAPLVRTLHRLAEEYNMTVEQLALTFVRDIEGVTSVVIGSETVAQTKNNVDLFHATVLPEAVREKVFECFQSVGHLIISPWEWNR